MKNIWLFMVFKIKQKYENFLKKYGFKQDCAMRYSTHKPFLIKLCLEESCTGERLKILHYKIMRCIVLSLCVHDNTRSAHPQTLWQMPPMCLPPPNASLTCYFCLLLALSITSFMININIQILSYIINVRSKPRRYRTHYSGWWSSIW